MAIIRYFSFLAIVIFLGSCNLEQAAKLHENLPRASGKAGEIILVIDSAEWLGATGRALKDIFQEPLPYLPRYEPMFNLNKIDPRDFQSILRRQKSIMIVSVLGENTPGNRRLKNYFTSESIDKIQDDSSLFMFVKKDEYAKGQEIVHLFGETREALLNNINKNKSKLQQYFLQNELHRMHQSLYAAKVERGISRHINSKLGCELQVPYGYEIALEGEKFIWLRNFSPDVDKSIYIGWTDYNSEEMFSLDSLIELRTRLSKPYILYKPEDTESFMLTETANFDVFRNEMNFKGLYAVSMRGMWKLNKYFMGGPFLGYAMVDESRNRFYYIESFLYSPGSAQRDYLRELETIMQTFKLGELPS